MAVYKTSRSKTARRARMSVKARPRYKTVRKDAMSATDSSYRSIIPRVRRPDYGFPDKLVTSLRYVDNITLTGGVGVIGSNVFRMNSLHDPDLSGIGHQPMYYDQICGAVGNAPYSRYRVLGSTITVKYTLLTAPASAATNIGPVIVGLQTSSTNGLYATNAFALCEASGSRWTYIGDKAGGNNVITMKASYLPQRDLGLDPGDDTIAAQQGNNPSAVFHAIPWKVDTATGAVVSALVEIVYKVEFFQRNEVNSS